MTDSKSLHFLKHFPAQYILTALFILVLFFYIQTDNQFFQRVIDTILGALLGILTGKWTQPNTPNNNAITGSGDINVTPIEPEIKEENL